MSTGYGLLLFQMAREAGFSPAVLLIIGLLLLQLRLFAGRLSKIENLVSVHAKQIAAVSRPVLRAVKQSSSLSPKL